MYWGPVRRNGLLAPSIINNYENYVKNIPVNSILRLNVKIHLVAILLGKNFHHLPQQKCINLLIAIPNLKIRLVKQD